MRTYSTAYGSFTEQYKIVYTDPIKPIVSANNIKDTKVTINWSAEGNPSYTTYTLQKRIPGNAWQNIYSGDLKTYTDTGLTDETIYHYRVFANSISGNTNRDAVCLQDGLEYIAVTTTANPAVAAAQEAAIAAQAAKKAAEDTVQYSLDAKNEATESKNKAQEVYDLVSSLELGNVKEDVSFIKNTMSTPVIQSVKGQNNATATCVNHFTVKINAAGILENLRYRTVCDGFDSGWTSENIIIITGLTDPGIKTAQIYVSNNATEPDKGSVATKEFVFFKL